jgi:hypothetical protein
MAEPDRFARELRARVVSAGSTTEDAQALIAELAPPEERLRQDDGFRPLDEAALESERVRCAEVALRRHGLVAQPRLRDGGRVVIRTSPRFALQAALVPGLVLAVVAGAGYWVYGFAFAAAAGLAFWLISRNWDWLDQRLPRVVPRGHVLGLLVSVPLLLVAGLAVVLPVRAHRTATANRSVGEAALQAAQDALGRGDWNAAYTQLDVAATRPVNQGIVAGLRARAVGLEVQSLLADQDRKAGIFDQADRAQRAGQARMALKLFRSIAGFRDADARAAELSSQLKHRRGAARGR